MPSIPSFYSINEAKKPAGHRVYHNNSACASGRQIGKTEVRSGTNNYHLCEDCVMLNKQGK